VITIGIVHMVTTGLGLLVDGICEHVVGDGNYIKSGIASLAREQSAL
jgi:hypothetical protein